MKKNNQIHPLKHSFNDFLSEVLDQCKKDNFTQPETVLSKQEQILNSFLFKNQFFAIFNLQKAEFSFVKKEVKDVLNYEKEEFTLGLLLKIIPPLELFLVIEYAEIAIRLMSGGFHFKVLQEAYLVSFPIYKKGSKKLSRVSRNCLLFELKNELPASFLEIWEDRTFSDDKKHVQWVLYTPSPDDALALNETFYHKWLDKLGVKFTRRELQTLVLSESGKPVKEIANNLGISPYVVEEYFKNMKKKVRQVADKLNSDREFTRGIPVNIEVPYSMTRKELIHYSYTFGLLPDNLLKQQILG